MSRAATAGWLSLKVKESLSSQLQVTAWFLAASHSRLSRLTRPPVEISGRRTLTVKVRVSNCPGSVRACSTIRRRTSAFTVVAAAAVGSPSVTVTR